MENAASIAPNLTPVLGRYYERDWSHGQGHRLYDVVGRAYLDFANGIAVTALGLVLNIVPEWSWIGEGEFYEGFNIRFNPAIQTARDGRLGSRLVDDDKLNFAPRAGWAWTPSKATSWWRRKPPRTSRTRA